MIGFPSEAFGAVERRVGLEVLAGCRSRPARSMLAFAEQEIVLPAGPYEGLRFSTDRQPYTRLWFGAIDSGRWCRHNAVGPTQSGKTLAGFIIPTLYHLFELRETVVCGLPSLDMAGDKWGEDLKPVIERSRYRDLLPRSGRGSRDGATPTAIRFRNGVTLKFLTGGGGDKKRAGYTSRVVVITETDGMDESGGRSRESDKITQLEARTRAYGSRKRVYLECTVTTEEGRTWREHAAGTASKIVVPCPRCRAWVTPEREHLVGWGESEHEVAARQAGHLVCPECSEPWTEAERADANRQGRLVHRGQEITPEGEIAGSAVPTDTLSLRWNAANNLFVEAGDVAADEWRGRHSKDADNAEKELNQFVWVVPHSGGATEVADLDERRLCRRQSGLARGFVPDARACLTLGGDVSSRAIHWSAIAWNVEGGGGQEIGYGTIPVDAHSLQVERAVLLALRQLRDMAEAGWKTPQGEIVPLDLGVVDSHWLTPVVKAFCRESGSKWCASVGFGHRRYYQGNPASVYAQPKSTGAVVRRIGERYHAAQLKGERGLTWEFDADHWKSKLHSLLSCPAELASALLLHKAENSDEHFGFVRHLVAERQVEEYVPGDGVKVRWERVSRQNHWLDSTVLAAVAGHILGAVRTVDTPAPQGRKRISLSERQAARRKAGR